MKPLSICLWFNDNAEEAVNYYASIIPDTKIGAIARYDAQSAAVSGRPEGSVLTVAFTIGDQPLLALNGGPMFKFSQAISLILNCDTQDEVDNLWEKLSAGGEKQPCGWLIDKFGVAWQVVPTLLEKLMQDPDKEKVKRVMGAMLQMTKLDMAQLQQAYDGT